MVASLMRNANSIRNPLQNSNYYKTTLYKITNQVRNNTHLNDTHIVVL